MSDSPRTFFVVRHAQSRGNAGEPDAGHNSILSKLGEQQAEAVGSALAKAGPVARVWSSPFHRALQTALAIARASDCPVELHPEMHEYFHPGWMDPETIGLEPLETIATMDPRIGITDLSDIDPVRWWPRGDEDETMLDARLKIMADRLVDSAPPGPTVCVGHGASVSRLVKALLVDVPIPLDGIDSNLGANNASIFELHHDPATGAITPARLNDTDHLPEVT